MQGNAALSTSSQTKPCREFDEYSSTLGNRDKREQRTHLPINLPRVNQCRLTALKQVASEFFIDFDSRNKDLLATFFFPKVCVRIARRTF